MKAQNCGSLAVLKVAFDGFADVDAQLVQRVRFREDGLSQGAGGVAAFRGFFNLKHQLIHGMAPQNCVSICLLC